MIVSFDRPTSDVSILGSVYKRDEILTFRDAALVTVEANSNRDIINEDNAKSVAESVILKPISLEHRMDGARGFFTEAKYVYPHVLTSGIIFLNHTPPDIVSELIEGKYSLSVEGDADNAICTYCKAKFASNKEYCNHLKARRVYNSYRDFENMRATGGALTKNPAGSLTNISADKISIVASADTSSTNAEKQELADMVKSGVAMADGSFPIANEVDLKASIQAIKDGEGNVEVLKHITSRASAIGGEILLQGIWTKGDSMPVEDEKKPQPETIEAEKADKEEKDIENKKEDDKEEKKEEDKNPFVKASEWDEIKAKLAEALAGLEVMKVENVGLKSELKASTEKYRKTILVDSGAITDEEWEANKESILASDEGAITLLASKAATKKTSLKLAFGGGKKLETALPSATKPKLVFG
jgi:hypothetical protein